MKQFAQNDFIASRSRYKKFPLCHRLSNGGERIALKSFRSD